MQSITVDINNESQKIFVRKHELTEEHTKKLNKEVKNKNNKQIFKFAIILFLTGSYFFVELIWGIKINSLGLITDAIHMLSDVTSLAIGTYSIKVSNKKNTTSATFGWKRMEIIGGYINSIMLVTLSFSMITNAIERIVKNEKGDLENNGIVLIIISSVGIGINLIGLLILGHSHHHHSDSDDHSHSNNEKSNKSKHNSNHSSNINMKAVLIHLIGDTLGSVCVVISGCIIQSTSFEYRFLADPITSLIISFVIILGSFPLIIKSTKILLQHVPNKIDAHEIKEEILKIGGVNSIHEFHIWQLDSERVIGTVHISIPDYITGKEFMEMCDQVKLLMHKHGIHNTTIQPEYVESYTDDKDDKCFEPLCQQQCSQKHCC